MKPARRSVVVALLAVALSAAVAAPAGAVFYCGECEPSMPATTRCLDFCNGQIIHFCSDWFFFGCDGLVVLPSQSRVTTADSDELTKERFLRSLAAEADEPVRDE